MAIPDLPADPVLEPMEAWNCLLYLGDDEYIPCTALEMSKTHATFPATSNLSQGDSVVGVAERTRTLRITMRVNKTNPIVPPTGVVITPAFWTDGIKVHGGSIILTNERTTGGGTGGLEKTFDGQFQSTVTETAFASYTLPTP